MIRQVIFLQFWYFLRNWSRSVTRLSNLNSGPSQRCGSCEKRKSGIRAIFVHSLLFSTFFVFGMSVGMAGPTLMDYLASYFADIDIIMALSWLLFAQASMRFVGAIFAGFTIDRFNCSRILMLLICLTLNAVFLAVIPTCRELWILILTTAAAGYCVGVLDTATNVQLLELHGKKVSPYLQALYFSYGFGAFVSPLIAEPFLSGESGPELMPARREQPLPYGGWKHRHHRSRHNNITHGIQMADEAYGSEVQFAYWIIAVAHVPVVIGLAYLYIQEVYDNYHEKKRRAAELSSGSTSDDEEDSNDKMEEAQRPTGIWHSPYRFQIICISLWTSLLVFLYDGIQGSYGGYVYTYAVKSSLHMSPAEGAFLTSVFWGSLALGRLISIPIALLTTPKVMLFGDLVGTITSSLLMLIFRHSRAVLWIGTSAVGLFMSNVFPSSVALVEQYFDVTGTVTCMFVVSAAIGEMVIPLIVGKVFDIIGAVSFLAEGCILCFAALGAYLAVLITGKGFSTRTVPRTEVKIGDEEKEIESKQEPAEKAIEESSSVDR